LRCEDRMGVHSGQHNHLLTASKECSSRLLGADRLLLDGRFRKRASNPSKG
jgi:hypothetical protein